MHQPRRIRKDFRSWKANKVSPSEVFEAFFDSKLDKEIFERVYSKCYFPATKIIHDVISEFSNKEKPFKVCYSFSGVFLEQLQKLHPELLDIITEMVKTNHVELLSQTYYHSLASIYVNDLSEFRYQVEEHKKTIKKLFGYETKIFENTELIYNNLIAREVASLGFDGIITEGADRILNGKSPHFLYVSSKANIKVLLRDYRLSDDIAFRFSNKQWSEYPLTASKYVQWVSNIPDPFVLVFVDYETFGEHHWPDSGIHKFLQELPYYIDQKNNIIPSLPREIVSKVPPSGEIDVDENRDTISWADVSRDLSAWLGNEMQKTIFNEVYAEHELKHVIEGPLTKLWRYLQISDNYYYMYTGYGGPAEVHRYFSGPLGLPEDVYFAFSNVVFKFKELVKKETLKKEKIRKILLLGLNNEKEFRFSLNRDVELGVAARGYLDFLDALNRVSAISLEYHTYNSDLEKWFSSCLNDEETAKKISNLRKKKIRGERLRKELIRIIERKIEKITTL
ncbi:MAG: alpha-amylase [Thermoproteota archaeon]|nr:glycoside hydrolase family 57 protein [Candidatus Brockarchaeota archaeon]